MSRTHLILLHLFCCTVATAAAQEPSARFYRAINLNGPAMVIDGQPWEAGDAKDLRCAANAFENQNVPLKPATDFN
ncbi:MAG: hypothetical protein JSS02_19690, partial [Planctomycetes bacterium]|nr:hypothetical protein [Planctomycetota bacterium]